MAHGIDFAKGAQKRRATPDDAGARSCTIQIGPTANLGIVLKSPIVKHIFVDYAVVMIRLQGSATSGVCRFYGYQLIRENGYLIGRWLNICRLSTIVLICLFAQLNRACSG
jgi:hypothetical protein